ncbi:MAG: nucleoside deaminase [Planctomycetota bacterium]|nr:nucleoside deaminase [Planctomycetota bacterium]
MNAFSFDDEYFIGLALKEAEIALEEGEVPAGCVVVRNGTVIAKAHNQVEKLCDSTAHAEILALTQAFASCGTKLLPDCSLYVTVEPCLMCAGAILLARIKRVVYGCSEPKFGAVESLYSVMGDRRLNHNCEVTAGVLKEKCAEVMRRFFDSLRTAKRAVKKPD